MSIKPHAVRGTQDLFGNEQRIFTFLISLARQLSSLYGFQEITTPIFEFIEVFKRTLGEESDVVGKEMYVFNDRGGETLCLRPEFTAGIVRALISRGMLDKLPLKLFSSGPVFRYERPQKGRKRQFHQLNFEIFGIKDPIADIELISMAVHLLTKLEIKNKTLLEINSLGDKDSRLQYRQALVDYFSNYKEDLSEDSKIRLEKNPLRILDSKDENDKKISLNAPLITNYYSDISKKFFDEVQEGLTILGIDYKLNLNLVRGLDYYCHTVFEFTTEDLGSQNAILAGGRYDYLVSMMGSSKDVPAVGFAGGLERLAALYQKEITLPRPVTLIPIGPNAEKEAMIISNNLRYHGIKLEVITNGNLGKKMKKSSSINSLYSIIFGDTELESEFFIVKSMDDFIEEKVLKSKLSQYLLSKLNNLLIF